MAASILTSADPLPSMEFTDVSHEFKSTPSENVTIPNYEDLDLDLSQILGEALIAIIVVNATMICVGVILSLLLLQILFSIFRRFCLGKRDKVLAKQAITTAAKGDRGVAGWEMPRANVRKWVSSKLNRSRSEMKGECVVTFEDSQEWPGRTNGGFEGDNRDENIPEDYLRATNGDHNGVRRQLRGSASLDSLLDRQQQYFWERQQRNLYNYIDDDRNTTLMTTRMNRKSKSEKDDTKPFYSDWLPGMRARSEQKSENSGGNDDARVKKVGWLVGESGGTGAGMIW